jgi:chemotaxis protein CheZ
MKDDLLEKAKQLVAALEQEDVEQSKLLLDDLVRFRESPLFQEVGRITRQLHDSMVSFALDERIVALTERDIPDARERLQYVISMTEQAADQTLTVVENLLPVSQGLHEQSAELAGKWQRFLDRDMQLDEFKIVSGEIAQYFLRSSDDLDTVKFGLNDILMAQGFQDITGQIIRKVIELVREVESSMVNVIALTAQSSGFKPAVNPVAYGEHPELPGPIVPGVNDKDGDVATSQVDVDDLLSSLGF